MELGIYEMGTWWQTSGPKQTGLTLPTNVPTSGPASSEVVVTLPGAALPASTGRRLSTTQHTTSGGGEPPTGPVNAASEPTGGLIDGRCRLPHFLHD